MSIFDIHSGVLADYRDSVKMGDIALVFCLSGLDQAD